VPDHPSPREAPAPPEPASARLKRLESVSKPPEPPRVSRRAAPPGVLSFEPIPYSRRPVHSPRPAPSLAERLPVASAEPPSRAEPVYPWKEEPSAAPRRPSRQIPLEDLDTLINRSWPPLANEAEPKRDSVPPMAPEPLEKHRGGPWPELAEPPPTDSTEAEAALRQWERLSRLDREQQGE
jgi:hypothetical protein